MKFTLIEGHYQTAESFPARRAHEERRRRRTKEDDERRTEREKAKLVWILQKALTKLMQIKTETTKARKRRNEIAIRVLYSEADKRILLLFGS
jgi:hypothetical protein